MASNTEFIAEAVPASDLPTAPPPVSGRAVAALAVGAIALSAVGCGEVRKQAQKVTGPLPAVYTALPQNVVAVASALHVLNRVGFGPKPGDVAHVVEVGPAAWIEEQLAYRLEERSTVFPGVPGPTRTVEIDQVEEDPTVDWRVNALETQQMEQDSPENLYCTDYDQIQHEMAQAALLRAIYSRRQLREQMADFWTNHFNIFSLKNDGRALVPSDTARVLRPHVLGRFHDMLTASAKSPAMLAYLDNNQNQKRDPRTGGGANENYARELLELHTLGVKSGYTMKDIQAVARCFTGWTVTGGFKRGQLDYEAGSHDDGMKYIPFLNLTILPKGGQKDADRVLETLSEHPATARFLVQKLCRRFLGEVPPEVAAKAESAYLRSGGDIRKTLRPILLDSDALLKPTGRKPILKRPLDMLVSANRALAADTDGGEDLQRHLVQMGQPLYEWPMPDGFPEKAAAWTGSLLPRWNFALALASNAVPGTRVDLNAPLAAAKARTEAEQLDALTEAVLARPAGAEEVKPIKAQVAGHMQRARAAGLPEATVLAEATGLLLASPTFQWK
ncbi:MAG: hypothetical protein JWN14_2753 [Chthonomonadales bacterium]|nr:hypothetical protein [Chthonomonadales bacterium]